MQHLLRASLIVTNLAVGSLIAIGLAVILLLRMLEIVIKGLVFLTVNVLEQLVSKLLVIFRLSFIIFHVDHLITAGIFIEVFIFVLWHDILEIRILVSVHISILV